MTDLANADDDLVAPLRAGQLSEGWRWLLAAGWTVLVPALMTLGDASHSLGKPTWWLDRDGTIAWWTILPFVPLVAAAIVAASNWRTWPLVAAVGVLTLGLTAVVDAGPTPFVALGEGAMAVAGLLVTVAAFAGRLRPLR